MATDPRDRSKVYLDTYLTHANFTKDDDTTKVRCITQFNDPEYPITKLLLDAKKNIDCGFTIAEPESEPQFSGDGTVRGYIESVPIETFCINKSGLTGTKFKWKLASELRSVLETYATGSYRSLRRTSNNDYDLGSTRVFSDKYVMEYERDTTT